MFCSWGRTEVFRFNKYIFLSPAVCALLSGKCTNISGCFFSLKYVPYWASLALREIYQISCFFLPWSISHNGPHWHHRLKKKKRCLKPISLKFGNCMHCQSLLSEVLPGLLFSALKREKKVASFPRAETKLLDMENFILDTKIAVPPGKKFSLKTYSDMTYVNSYSFEYFKKFDRKRKMKFPNMSVFVPLFWEIDRERSPFAELLVLQWTHSEMILIQTSLILLFLFAKSSATLQILT